MTSTRHLVLAAGLLGLCAIAVGILAPGGSLTVPGSDRAALRGARAAAHGELERLESVVPAGRAPDDGLWRPYLDVVEKELEHGHVDVAVRAWQDAYGAALASRSWESMIAVGDAFTVIGRASGTPRGARMNAREAYLTALMRARRDGNSTIAPSSNGASTSPRSWRRRTNKRSRRCARLGNAGRRGKRSRGSGDLDRPLAATSGQRRDRVDPAMRSLSGGPTRPPGRPPGTMSGVIECQESLVVFPPAGHAKGSHGELGGVRYHRRHVSCERRDDLYRPIDATNDIAPAHDKEKHNARCTYRHRARLASADAEETHDRRIRSALHGPGVDCSGICHADHLHGFRSERGWYPE